MSGDSKHNLNKISDQKEGLPETVLANEITLGQLQEIFINHAIFRTSENEGNNQKTSNSFEGLKNSLRELPQIFDIVSQKQLLLAKNILHHFSSPSNPQEEKDGEESKERQKSKKLKEQKDRKFEKEKSSSYFQIIEAFSSQQTSPLLELLFWLVFTTKFYRKSNRPLLIDCLFEGLACSFCAIYQDLLCTNLQKENLKSATDSNLVLDVLGLLFGIQVFMLFTNTFKSDSKMFNNRFLLDCVHFAKYVLFD